MMESMMSTYDDEDMMSVISCMKMYQTRTVRYDFVLK